jgi:hypothetical protein
VSEGKEEKNMYERLISRVLVTAGGRRRQRHSASPSR